LSLTAQFEKIKFSDLNEAASEKPPYPVQNKEIFEGKMGSEVGSEVESFTRRGFGPGGSSSPAGASKNSAGPYRTIKVQET
jgi:hypothetical protein